MINQAKVVESLRQEAASNPASNAVLHVWALRERARSQVTIEGLALRMKEEKFTFDKRAYEPLLRLMASLGLGRLQLSPTGKVVALQDVKTTLQSIGKVAVGGDTALRVYKKKTRFRKLVARPILTKPEMAQAVASLKSGIAKAPVLERRADALLVGLTVRLKSRDLVVPIPADMTTGEVAELLGWMRAGKAGA